MINFPRINTERCILDQITNNDVNTLLYIIKDKLSKHFLPELYEICKTETDILHIIKSFDYYYHKEEGFLWGIRRYNRLIGFIAIIEISNNPTIFYSMHPIFRNKGYIKECIPSIISYIFDNNLCQHITSEVFFDNKPSLYILLSSGFCIEKKNKEKFLLKKDRIIQ